MSTGTLQTTAKSKTKSKPVASVGQLVTSPGEFMEIDKKLLRADMSYQRESTPSKVQDIARDWQDVACNTIVVSRRPEGFFVVDGMHRVNAAKLVPHVRTLRCVVHDFKSKEAEAHAYLLLNTKRKSMLIWEKWNAMLLEKDANAIFIRDLVESSGYVVDSTNKKGVIRCVKCLLDIVKKDRAVLQSVWPLFLELADGHPITEQTVEPMCYIEGRLPEGQSLLMKPWREKLLELGQAGIARVGCEAAHARGVRRGGAKIWAKGLFDALNSGQKTNRLRVEGLQGDY
jgi:hypothetical protein